MLSLNSIFEASANQSFRARALSVKASGEFDYLPKEDIKLKISALVTKEETGQLVSGANVTIDIYDPKNSLIASTSMNEIDNGIYLWQSRRTVEQIFKQGGKGIYIAHVEASYKGGPTAHDLIEFHIDPPGTSDSTDQWPIITGASLIMVAISATTLIYVKKKRKP